MDVVGYSERGLLNAVFFTVAHEINGADLVNQLISLAKWPHREAPKLGQCERIMIEQSFSGFGTCDTVLLFGPKETGQVIFLEAKRYRLSREWNKFYQGCKEGKKYKGLTSNLFCQLFFKQCLARAVAKAGDRTRLVLQDGNHVPPPLNEARAGKCRKIGSNTVVHKAIDEIGPRLRSAFFLAVIPESAGDAERFWPSLNQSPISDWDTENWGFLSIRDIDEFCRRKQLTTVINTLNFNGSQLLPE